MSQYKNHFEIESDLSSEIEFYHFCQQVRLPENTIHQLVYHQQRYHQTISEFIHHGISKIKIEEVKYGLAYLSEAQKLLEYGASCGKNIDRQLIITTLHNEAVCYQRLGEQNRAAKYIQAIIFNLKAHIKNLQFSSNISKTTDNKTQKKSATLNQQVSKLKIQLAEYFLVFCSLNSQIGNRLQSLEAGKKAIKLYKGYFEELKIYHTSTKNIEILCLGEDKTKIADIIKNMKIYKSQAELEKECLDRIIMIAKNSIKKWNSHNKSNKGSQTVIDKYLAQYSIANLVQLGILQVPKNNREQTNIFIQGKKIIKNLANFTMGYFQIATQYRLISQKKIANQAIRNNSLQIKSSQLYYLLSIIFIALYIPYNFLFMKQIRASYEYHFKHDLLLKSGQTKDGTIDLNLLFTSHKNKQSHSKSTKKSLKLNSITKNLPGKNNSKNKNNGKKFRNKQHAFSHSNVDHQYLLSSRRKNTINQYQDNPDKRGRVVSSDSRKIRINSNQLKNNADNLKIQQTSRSGTDNTKVKRIRSVTRMKKQQTYQQQQSDVNGYDVQDYGSNCDMHKKQIDKTKKLTQRGSRSTSSDAYYQQLKGYQQKTIQKKQVDYPSLYKGFKKNIHKKQTSQAKKSKKYNNINKDSKYRSVSRESNESHKKKKKQAPTKKQKAKLKTIANYYL